MVESIPGPGQVKIGQNVGLKFQSKIGIYLILVLYFEFIGSIFIPVNGLQPPSPQIKRIKKCVFGKCVTRSSFYNIYSLF